MDDEVVEDSITMTSKGTFTLPVKMRRLLGISEKGAKLKIVFFPETSQAVLMKPTDFSDIQSLTKKYVRSDRPPLVDVSSFYQGRRKE